MMAGRTFIRKSTPTTAACSPSTTFIRCITSSQATPKGARPSCFLHGGTRRQSDPSAIFRPQPLPHCHIRSARFRRSKPLGEIRNFYAASGWRYRTLRQHLGIDSWFVFGGSWESTLAIAYASITRIGSGGLGLRGIFLCRKSEIDWFLYGLREIAPEVWRAFSGFIPKRERGDLPGRLS